MRTQNNDRIYVYNKTRETFVATEVSVADGYFSRLVGLLGKTRSWARPGRGLWIVPSHGIHTLGMLFTIDVIFLDRAKRVVHLEEHVRPFRVSKISLKAHSVLEVPPHIIFRTNTQVGDLFEIGHVGDCEASFERVKATAPCGAVVPLGEKLPLASAATPEGLR